MYIISSMWGTMLNKLHYTVINGVSLYINLGVEEALSNRAYSGVLY